MASSRLPRWVHRRWARFHGFFWIHCPICNEFYGGHEVKLGGSHIPTLGKPGHGKCVCNDCDDKAWVINLLTSGGWREYISD